MVTHGFELVKEQEIPELNSRAKLYRHVKTSAELLSVINDDENKVFGIVFRTPPADSTGVAHIMEHSVLCGSEKYPLKEPFVELVKGSLNTFLNAFTYPDRTCYPVASQNLKDFYNLIDVYIDAVFHPLIPPETLQQEGWHYELDSPDAPLAYKGVVFNEMKGVYSSPDSLLGRYSQQSLFPDTTYGVDSGGDPQAIPDLTYAQFKDFHDRYYHPSNARIYFYGDDDPEERLRLMDGYLQGFEPLQVDSGVALQRRFSEPRRVEASYEAGEEGGAAGNGAGPGDGSARKGMVTVNWLLTESDDAETSLGLGILSHILVGTPASPLRKALIDSGLGEDLTGGGMEGDLRQIFFSTGLKGIAVEDADKVEKLILETLERLAEDGIDPEMVAAAMNTAEFRLRENNTGSFPRGLLLMLRALTTWLYDGDPLQAMAFEAPLQSIQRRLAAGEPYFEDLLKGLLLGNTHRTTVLLRPEAGLRLRQEAEERGRLEQVKTSMSQEELLRIVEQTRLLRQRQETPDSPDALASIPTLGLEDLDKENKRIPLAEAEAGGVKVLHHDLPTNGIVYLDLGFDLHTLPQEYIPYLSLFGRALLGLGTEKEDYVRLSQRIGRSTGGIRAASFTTLKRDTKETVAWMFLRGKSTLPQSGELLAILKDILSGARLDNRERFRQMVLEEKADMETSLAPAGHRVVNVRLRSRFDEAGWMAEQMGGVSYLFFLRQLAEAVDNDWPSVLEKLEAMRRILLRRGNLLGNVTLDAAAWGQLQPQLGEFLAGLPDGASPRSQWQPGQPPMYEGLAFPAQVNYVGKGADLYALGYRLHGSVSVISNYLRTTWLWERVRVQGGAYGAFCQFDHRSGVLTLLSYRDPNILKTLDTFDLTGKFLNGLELSREELTKTVVGAIGDMDAYQLPDAKGYTSMLRWLAGETDELRQQIRDEVLGTKVEDFHAFGETLEGVKDAGSVVVLGSQEALAQASAGRGDWLQINKLL